MFRTRHKNVHPLHQHQLLEGFAAHSAVHTIGLRLPLFWTPGHEIHHVILYRLRQTLQVIICEQSNESISEVASEEPGGVFTVQGEESQGKGTSILPN